MLLPGGQLELARFAQDIVDACKVSQPQRAAAYRQYAQWIETGRQVGGMALANMLYPHLDKLHSNLFSPTDLKFGIDYENHYGEKELAMADMTSRVLTREWERRNIDTVFAAAVREALAYGCCPIKQLVKGDGQGQITISAKIVMPWQFGVYNETETELYNQEAISETVFLTKPEVWRRIAHLPDAEKLFKRIITGSNRSEGQGTPTSFFHQILSTAPLDTSLNSMVQDTPGGLVQLTSNPNFATLGPQIGTELFPMHEIWVKDDELNDFVTIQLIEPDILVAPLFKRTNLFCPGVLPYGIARPNEVANYFWGRSEIVDLMMLQQLMTTTLDDLKRLVGLQVDKLLAFSGDSISDEVYGQFRSNGYVNLGPNGQVKDVTPSIPGEIFKFIEMIEAMMEKIGGFSNILSGRGEQNVRAGSHAEMLMRTASPRLRDRALLVERQCAMFADATLSVMEAKDNTKRWIENDTSEMGDFILAQIPDDRRVSIDSHSSSPVFADDHLQQIVMGAKLGAIGPDTFIDLSSLPNKDLLKKKLQEMQKQKAEAQAKEDQKELALAQAKHTK